MVDGERSACLLREMTKHYEEHRAGTLRELTAWAQQRTLKGAVTLVHGPAAAKTEDVAIDQLQSRFEALRADGVSARDASKRLAKEHGLKTRDVYNRFAKGTG